MARLGLSSGNGCTAQYFTFRKSFRRLSETESLLQLQIAERHWNAHAFINIAALVNVDSSESKDSSGVIKSANIVFGYPSAHEGASRPLCAY